MAHMIRKAVCNLTGFHKEWIPWAMAAGRAALGPVLIAAAACSWNPLTLAGIVVTALLSDIFDGVLARRWKSDTPAVRLFDSMADTVFYLCVAAALWIAHPQTLRHNARMLELILALEAVRYALDLAKFGKPASYHSYLAKTWGLVMAISVIATFATGRGSTLFPVALCLGIVCNLEGLAMSLILPVWHKDVAWLGKAWQIRTGNQAKAKPVLHKAVACVLAGTGMLCAATSPAFAVSGEEVQYLGGTATIARGSIGTMDMTAADKLSFRSKSTSTSAGEIVIPYAQIGSFGYTHDVARHLGLLATIVVGLIKPRQRIHVFTINYSDAANGTQAVRFEVSKEDAPTLLAVLRARSSQACGTRPINTCGVVFTP